MIKRLRIQFISVTMSLIAMLLLIIFLLICSTIWIAMDADATASMQETYMEPFRPGYQRDTVSSNHPCFILYYNSQGQLQVYGSAYYDLTDMEALSQILQEAQATGKDEGILLHWGLRFLVQRTDYGEQYVFMDICRQLKTMESLVMVCLLTFVLSLAVFFLIVLMLSRWITKPVETAWTQQRQFVADASHELKTPLTVILTNAELLQSPDYTPQDKHRFAGSILTMATQMRGLVENMLELARLDNPLPTKQLAPVDLSDLAENCVLHFEPVYFEAGRELQSHIQPGLSVLGSSQYLRQVVEILLDNGCKYSTPGTQITLSLTQNHNHCLLQVASQGEELTPGQCKDIFKRFYRADEARSRDGSYGLGLSIAESMVAEHGGKIWATGKDGVNTFSVSLPLQK